MKIIKLASAIVIVFAAVWHNSLAQPIDFQYPQNIEKKGGCRELSYTRWTGTVQAPKPTGERATDIRFRMGSLAVLSKNPEKIVYRIPGVLNGESLTLGTCEENKDGTLSYISIQAPSLSLISASPQLHYMQVKGEAVDWRGKKHPVQGSIKLGQ